MVDQFEHSHYGLKHETQSMIWEEHKNKCSILKVSHTIFYKSPATLL